MSPDTWTKLLYAYGPNALLVFLVFVVIGRFIPLSFVFARG
jgi:hypothetical protein